jgi:SOS-response transcriptional repressor LexA
VTNIINIAAKEEEFDRLTDNLHRLMQVKGVSEAELARKSNIPQPTLHKILSGKTDDPRASTLRALASFFEISIDELLTGTASLYQGASTTKTQSIPVISWSECVDAIKFIKKLIPSNWANWTISDCLSQNAYALISKASMEPCFPKGTILIVDTSVTPEDGDMVVVHYPNTQEATIRKLSTDGPTKLLLSINANANPDNLENDIKILGVLLKSVFSFHE